MFSKTALCLRYDPSEWVCEEKPGWGDKGFYSTDGGLEITLWSNSADKNLTPEFLEDRFQESALVHLDEYDEIECLPSDIISINNVTFLYHCALGTAGEKQRQIFQYTYSTKDGCVSLFFKAKRKLTETDEELVREFLRGHSTDGQGCKGIAPLRTVKNVLDILGSGSSSSSYEEKTGFIRFHKS